MKKLFILLLAFTTTFNNAYSQSGRGKIVAAADAAGALGGAGSVASIAGWFSWTPAAPVAGIALLVGAVIGGVGASAAVSKAAPSNNPKSVLTQDVILSDNYVDQVGVLHNQILYDYFSANSTYTPSKFFNFINQNKSKYGIVESPITLEYLEMQYSITENFDEIEDINTFILDNLPSKVDKAKYSKFLNDLGSIVSSKEAIVFIKNFEKMELKNASYDDKTKGVLGSFFSTYRHSLALWN